MNAPRLLPLIGVSVAGVLAINALGGARDLPQMLSAARAAAEGVAATPAKGGKSPPPPAQAKAAASPPPSALPTSVPAPAGGICAPNAAELAKSAGLSPSELQTLTNLQARRGQIDKREQDLDTQVQLLAAAEGKLDAKLKAMTALKAEIEALMGQADQKTQAEVDRLTVVYSKMKDADAAAVMTQLDDKVRVPIAAAMKPAVLSKILAKMNPSDAKKLTELLAHRFAAAQQLVDASKAPPAAQAAATPPAPAKPGAKPSAKPAAQAATAEAGDANVDDSAAKPAKAKPIKLAKRAPARKKPAYRAPKAKPPVEEAKAKPAKPVTEVKDATAKPAAPPAAAPAKVG